MTATIDQPTPTVGVPPTPKARESFGTLALGSIGVVYGDIGTSPLYALKESLTAASVGQSLTADMIFGVLSLVLWTLIIIVTLKYVTLIMRADNNGEGGTLALMALVQRIVGQHAFAISILGMIGAALFYGDAIITPAISVLSAVEGLKLVTPALDHLIIPLSIFVLLGLFALQSRGTGSVGRWFGPIMVVWFVVMAVGGLSHLLRDYSILAAFNPVFGIRFLLNHGEAGLVALGAVFLTVTGAEALYADMGHFGRPPIRVAWLFIVLPSLALNYLGQGAMLLADPAALENPFFRLYPTWALLPMVLLATIATIIASQAVITGAFSLTRQAIHLGLLPRMDILRTSETESGQIYVPRVNWLLLIAVLLVILIFKNSSALASAYGVAVTGTMVVTAVMAFFVMWKCWEWPVWLAVIVIAPFMLTDTVFLMANLLKIFEGGWMPLTIGAALMMIMLTWRRGTHILAEKARKDEMKLTDFMSSILKSHPGRVRGTAVFLTGHPDSTPSALLHNLKHNQVLHEQNVVVSVLTESTPHVSEEHRLEMQWLSDGFAKLTLRFGFMERPNIPKALSACRTLGLKFDVMKTTFFLSRRALRETPQSKMPHWQEKLFISLARSANDATHHFNIPPGRAMEVGTQISV